MSPDQPKGASIPKAIAVLPLANMSADPENEYFSDGMTEEIINALSKVPGVHVASRSSCFAFKGKKDVDARQIGEKLGVSTLLEGSVRKVGNRIRIAAQLVNVDNGYQLWSETYDRQLEDIFAVQDEISRSIVDALKLQLAGGTGEVVAPTKNLDAYTTYLKGRFHFNKFSEMGLRKASTSSRTRCCRIRVSRARMPASQMSGATSRTTGSRRTTPIRVPRQRPSVPCNAIPNSPMP